MVQEWLALIAEHGLMILPGKLPREPPANWKTAKGSSVLSLL